jgi:hypothetical protein
MVHLTLFEKEWKRRRARKTRGEHERCEAAASETIPGPVGSHHAQIMTTICDLSSPSPLYPLLSFCETLAKV